MAFELQTNGPLGKVNAVPANPSPIGWENIALYSITCDALSHNQYFNVLLCCQIYSVTNVDITGKKVLF